MKKTKKQLTYLLAFLLMVTGICQGIEVQAAQAGEYEYWVINNGEKGVVIKGYNGSGGDVTIPSEIEGVAVTDIDSEIFETCEDDITSITIPEGVKNIDFAAFRGCSNLSEVTIPGSVKNIGEQAFGACDSLACLMLPEGVETIGDDAFYECDSLTEVTIPASVTSIGKGVFQGCGGLVGMKVADGNAKYDSRQGCNAIIESKSGMLISGCKATVIPVGVTGIGESAFESLFELESITIPSGVLSIGPHAFDMCGGLENVDIPEGVATIGAAAFAECHELCNVMIPESVKTIGDSAFNNCYRLTDVANLSGITSIGEQAFYQCNCERKIHY